jgi:predicted transglutaminase-like cysteine proteinase
MCFLDFIFGNGRKDMLLEIETLKKAIDQRNQTIAIMQQKINALMNTSDIEAMKTVMEDLKSKLAAEQAIVNGLQTALDDLQKENENLKKNIIAPDPMAEYYNNKYPKAVITWGKYIAAQNGELYRIDYDVRGYIENHDNELENLAMQICASIPADNYDARMAAVQAWIVKNITYEYDEWYFKKADFWLEPINTYYNRRGDCEDGALLMNQLALFAGIPYWRLRLNCGYVSTKDDGSGQEGHAYLTYCRQTDDKFVVCDWCWNPNQQPMKDRPLHESTRTYYGVWFSFNREYAFSKPTYDVGVGGNSKKMFDKFNVESA